MVLYPNEVARLKSDPIVAQIPFTATDIENRIRAIERKEKKATDKEKAEKAKAERVDVASTLVSILASSPTHS